MQTVFITGQVDSNTGTVPQISTTWNRWDVWNTIKVRWSIGRMRYKVNPGIYAIGTPGEDSRVFVTANFKLTFDHVRLALDGMNAWLMVLDTKGINVWCAAGKGTFSTKEVVRRIRIHHLDKVVDHRKLILPQLGATGVAAHDVKRMTGFTVVYGPVRANDIKAFLEAGLKATDAMRRVTFPMVERLKLIPVDIFYGKYYMVVVPLVFFLMSGFTSSGYSIDIAFNTGWKAILNLYAGYLSGCVLVPALLPWIPFRMFSLKGLVIGWLTAILLLFSGMMGTNILEIFSWFLMIGGLSSFMAMNFTGSSTFTSLSGVQKEMKMALPVQIAMASLGLVGWILSKFFAL